MKSRIPDHTSSADLTSTDLKLRFDEAEQPPFTEESDDGRKDLQYGNKG